MTLGTMMAWVSGVGFSAGASAASRAEVHRSGPLFSTAAARADEECCTDPGEVAGCWWQDAERDGVVCLDDSDCVGTNGCDTSVRVEGMLPPNGWGLCECSDSGDCRSGICRDGRCGPSYCNGILVCACWGGCTEADAWGHGTPREACEDVAGGFPGACCEGTYAAEVDGTGVGYCSDTCPDAECVDDADCADAVEDELSLDCAQGICDNGRCGVAFVNTGAVCTDNTQIPNPLPDWHGDCAGYLCSAEGTCLLSLLAAGTPCDDADICTATSECDAAGACLPLTPDATQEVCCDPAVPETYDDGNPCTLDSCSDISSAAPFRDVAVAAPDNTACDDGVGRVNDACGVYMCVSGGCVEDTASYVGADCRDTDWTACVRYECSGSVGEEGSCVAVNRNEGLTCAWPNAPDPCDRQVCRGGGCEYELAAGAVGCTPASGVADPCCEYACDASHQCAATGCDVPSAALDVCDGRNMGILDGIAGSSVSAAASNRCASDDYKVLAEGIFWPCNLVDDGENVHRYTETTHLTDFQLRHTEITLTGDGSFDPVVYTATDCEGSVGGPITQDTQYTCAVGADTLVTMSGPWPLVDTPTSAVSEGFTTANTRETSVFVDARNTAIPSGGDYSLAAEVVAHDNSGCINTADEVAAPRILGGESWKERFRGNVTDHANFFDARGVDLSEYCWGGGAADAADPKFAFFRVDLPGGSDVMSTGTLGWDHTYKLYTDPLGSGELDDVLAFFGSNFPDGDCTAALTDMQTCRTSASLGPREMVFESGDGMRGGFLSVSNRAAGAAGNYELNVLRVPRPFLGLSQQFVGAGEGLGCACGAPDGWSQSFDLVGHRLDFVPTNDDVAGYAVRKTATADPSAWLVAGGEQVCQGLTCSSPSDTTPFDMGFQFPYSGALFDKFCVDAAGRIILAQQSSDCVNKWDVKPNTDEFLHGSNPGSPAPVTPAVAPLWGSIVPCNSFRRPTFSSAGDVTCEAWALFSCAIWKWNESSCSGAAEIRKQFTSFEGTAAMVITWDGFDGMFNPRSGGGDHALDFQVILRVDGRITFFYRQPVGGAADWAEILNSNGWLVGLSGGRSVGCADDDECDAAFNTTGLACDRTDYTVQGELVWEARDKCMNPVNLQAAVDVPVSGAWQGE